MMHSLTPSTQNTLACGHDSNQTSQQLGLQFSLRAQLNVQVYRSVVAGFNPPGLWLLRFDRPEHCAIQHFEVPAQEGVREGGRERARDGGIGECVKHNAVYVSRPNRATLNSRMACVFQTSKPGWRQESANRDCLCAAYTAAPRTC